MKVPDVLWIVFVGPVLIIIFSALDIVINPAAMATRHKMLAHQFEQLDMKMVMSKKTDATAKSFQVQRQLIETMPPSI